MVVVPECFPLHRIIGLKAHYGTSNLLLEPQIIWLGLLQYVFHFIFKYSIQKLRNLFQRGRDYGANRDASFKFYKTTKWVDISIEPMPLLMITIKDDRLTETKGHSSFSVFPVTLPFPSAIHKNLGALHHEAFNQTLILMTSRRA